MLERRSLSAGRRSSGSHSPAKRLRISSPEAGRSLGATVTKFDRPLRRAVEALASVESVDPAIAALLFDCTARGPNAGREPDTVRLSWFLPCVALADAFVARRSAVRDFHAALEWFTGDKALSVAVLDCFRDHQLSTAIEQLAGLTTEGDLLELFPYVIEPHGHITRNNFETCAIAKRTRALKKSTGVYYTPSDVASFIVRSITKDCDARDGTWLDPACGTGVFLREVLRLVASHSGSKPFDAFNAVTSQIYAIDKSALATDLSAFVLLTDCALLTSMRQHPFVLWKELKRNFVCMDALSVDCTSVDSSASLRRFFPRIAPSGFDHVVMNPPYSPITVESGYRTLWHSLEDREQGSLIDAHLPFTEMLWKLTSPNGSGAAVLPLSIASNTLHKHRRLRHKMLSQGGMKEFLFFDREPQALFGEDIKTRNLILIWHKQDHGISNIKTSRLLKWTGKQRPHIFSRERLVNIDETLCTRFIPKLGTNDERGLYESLSVHVSKAPAERIGPQVGRLTLSQATKLDDDTGKRTVLVGGTAYNFINCFFASSLPVAPPYRYSESAVTTLTFAKTSEALASFALLTSRMCFWLWHVEGDGFHLTSDFLKRLPLWNVVGSPGSVEVLAPLGKQLWDAYAAAITGSVNGGKQTYSFHCGYDHAAARKIEQYLSKFYRKETLSECLDRFVDAIVSVDGTCRIRSLNQHRQTASSEN
jgi:hypothetical protein